MPSALLNKGLQMRDNHGTVHAYFNLPPDYLQNHLQDLRTTDPRQDKKRIEQTKGGLLANSYRWVLKDTNFQRWRDDEQSRLLWIKGEPGKGKTMLLCGLIDELGSTPDSGLLSFFFCQATDANINNATAVLRGLIYLLVDQRPSLITHVQKKYDSAGNPLFRSVNAWVALSEIFSDILNDPSLPPTRLVIDALDECIEGLNQLLQLVVQTSSEYSGVKWIVSSRNWPSIEKYLDSAPRKVRLSLELNEKSVSTAVTIYVRFKVEELAKRNWYSNDTRDAVERYLSTNAHGTFLWVALVCQELADISEWAVEEALTAFPPGLDALYRRMMEQIYRSRHAELLRKLLAIISVVYQPVTLDELPVLVDIPDRASGSPKALTEIIGSCGSFLTLRGRTVFFVHQSARDFMLRGAHDNLLPSRIEDVHYNIFLRSLQAMRKTLRRNIYDLGGPGFSIDKVTPPNPDPLAMVRYSCVYWVNHLCDCERENTSKDLQNGGLIDTFLREKYLHWLEAEGQETSLLTDLVRDICRFSLYHMSAIETSPLQVYTSAVIFSPARSITRNQFENKEFQWIIRKPIMADNWSACLLTLESHSDWVSSVAWSHDAARLASASYDRKVKIWDPATGQCISTLEGHSSSVRSVAWSHDAAWLASASNDRTVKIWESATSQCVSTLEGHDSSVLSVTWSHDAARLASASDDKTVKIWDPATSQCVSTLEGHSSSVRSVAWSHDATRLASASCDRKVKIWNSATSQCVSTLEGHSNWVSSVAWSHDAARLVSGSYDGTVKIWNPENGQCMSTLEGHSSLVRSVTLSHDAAWLASASNDETVKVWDPNTGQCVSTLEGHSNWVSSVAWSHDASQLVSASEDGTVKIWNPAISQYVSTVKDHSSPVRSVAWSHDAAWLASASFDGTVKIWDPATGQCVSTLNGHSSSVDSVTWSHDAARLASASDDRTVKIWDPATSQCVFTLKGHHDRVRSVAWSYDATRLASASDDETAKIWDLATGQCVSTLSGHSDCVSSVAWSHDAAWLASASFDGTVKIWDPATGQCVSTLNGHSSSVDSVAWSHDAAWLASASDDKTIKIWNPATGQCISTLMFGHSIKEVQFHESNLKYLHTERGTFDVANSTLDPASGQPLSPKPVGYGLSSNNTWITYQGEKLLWLPPEYRPLSSAISGTTMSIGCSSGRVLMFKFPERIRL
ncbi:NACHT nucleoside triphosphatase [Corynascus novoguineensis]|uniref:NACHT nucleoside triphosphatase n=1 Tax=Corynascus novoguineensis TaxID=1126955 RepID=A0AAN7CXJ9_9PEZI|nr:NACHT nucleoside triphosphatase [Corynascus novoguineensis]